MLQAPDFIRRLANNLTGKAYNNADFTQQCKMPFLQYLACFRRQWHGLQDACTVISWSCDQSAGGLNS